MNGVCKQALLSSAQRDTQGIVLLEEKVVVTHWHHTLVTFIPEKKTIQRTLCVGSVFNCSSVKIPRQVFLLLLLTHCV